MPGAPYFAVGAILIGILSGTVIGGVSGVVVSRFRIPPFVVTLGMLSIARGLTLLYSGGLPIPDLTPRFRWIGTGDLVGIPIPIFVLIVVFLVAWWTLTRTRFGRHVYATGGNPRAATTSGINVSRIRLLVYIISVRPQAWPASCWPRARVRVCRKPAFPMNWTPSPPLSSAARACPGASAG